MSESIVQVGKIARAHGLKGEVYVFPLTDFKERFEEGSTLILTPSLLKTTHLKVEYVRYGPKFITVKFFDVNDRNQAELLSGAFLGIASEKRGRPPKDAYWIDEIIGLKVFDLTGNLIGQVTEILESQANDIYVVSHDEKRYLVPAVKEIIRRVDIKDGSIIIDPPVGLLE